MNKPLALERGIFLDRGPVGGQWSGGTPLPWNFEKKAKFCFIGRACLLGLRRYVKESSGNGYLSLHRGPVGKPGGDSFTGDFERRTKEALKTERLPL
jgi:hypothetical protein